MENELAGDIPPEIKAALVMLTLGEDVAGELFKKLGKDEIKFLNKGMMNLTMLTPDDEERILIDYYALLSEMKGLVVSGGEETSGVVMVAEILNNIEKQHEERIFEQLMEIDPELAEEIRNNMFVFADLVNIDARGIQTLLKEVDNQTLLLALKTAPDAIKERVFANLSARAVQMLREDMEVMPPVKISEVEKAQASITQLALRLEAEGKIIIAKAGAAEEFV